MQVQVHTDNHIQGADELSQHVQAVVEHALARFTERITRVEVHLSDENSSVKSGNRDMRCVMEARIGGLQPITVTHDDQSLHQAIDGAVDKLKNSLAHTLGRLSDTKGRTSFGGDQAV